MPEDRFPEIQQIPRTRAAFRAQSGFSAKCSCGIQCRRAALNFQGGSRCDNRLARHIPSPDMDIVPK